MLYEYYSKKHRVQVGRLAPIKIVLFCISSLQTTTQCINCFTHFTFMDVVWKLLRYGSYFRRYIIHSVWM